MILNHFYRLRTIFKWCSKSYFKIHESDYDRIKIFDKDVRVLLEIVPNNFFSKIVVLFPDPWKKRRHKKRRIFNTKNISLFLNKLKKYGEIYFSTDIEDYF